MCGLGAVRSARLSTRVLPPRAFTRAFSLALAGAQHRIKAVACACDAACRAGTAVSGAPRDGGSSLELVRQATARRSGSSARRACWSPDPNLHSRLTARGSRLAARGSRLVAWVTVAPRQSFTMFLHLLTSLAHVLSCSGLGRRRRVWSVAVPGRRYVQAVEGISKMSWAELAMMPGRYLTRYASSFAPYYSFSCAFCHTERVSRKLAARAAARAPAHE